MKVRRCDLHATREHGKGMRGFPVFASQNLEGRWCYEVLHLPIVASGKVEACVILHFDPDTVHRVHLRHFVPFHGSALRSKLACGQDATQQRDEGKTSNVHHCCDCRGKRVSQCSVLATARRDAVTQQGRDSKVPVPHIAGGDPVPCHERGVAKSVIGAAVVLDAGRKQPVELDPVRDGDACSSPVAIVRCLRPIRCVFIGKRQANVLDQANVDANEWRHHCRLYLGCFGIVGTKLLHA